MVTRWLRTPIERASAAEKQRSQISPAIRPVIRSQQRPAWLSVFPRAHGPAVARGHQVGGSSRESPATGKRDDSHIL